MRELQLGIMYSIAQAGQVRWLGAVAGGPATV